MALRKAFRYASDWWFGVRWIVADWWWLHFGPDIRPEEAQRLAAVIAEQTAAFFGPRAQAELVGQYRLPAVYTAGRVSFPPAPRWCGAVIAYGVDELGTDERITVRCTMPDHHWGDHAAPAASFERAGWSRTPF